MGLVKIAIIEDDPGDVELLQAYLDPVQPETFDLSIFQWLKEAQYALEHQVFDLVLLDLSLPDSKGLATFRAIASQVPTIPIVVLSGMDDQALALQAVRMGAQDYLTKDQVNSQILIRAIRYAIERQRLLLQAEQAARSQHQDRDLQLLEHLPTQHSQVTARLYNSAGLRESEPKTFENLVHQYSRLLELSLKQRVYELDTSVSQQIQTLAEQLSFLRVGPRDVIEIHSYSIKQQKLDAPFEKSSAYAAESRFLVLELMGHLVALYRRYSVAANALSSSPPHNSDS